jgi:hypothetical protein
MPENADIIEVPFVMDAPCALEEAQEAERLLRPVADNFWLEAIVPVGDLPALEWVAKYRWYDNEISAMMR